MSLLIKVVFINKSLFKIYVMYYILFVLNDRLKVLQIFL